jgi:hypothetical protein
LGLPPLIFENRYLSHFQRNAVILVKTDKIGYKQELAPHPDQKGTKGSEPKAALIRPKTKRKVVEYSATYSFSLQPCVKSFYFEAVSRGL